MVVSNKYALARTGKDIHFLHHSCEKADSLLQLTIFSALVIELDFYGVFRNTLYRLHCHQNCISRSHTKFQVNSSNENNEYKNLLKRMKQIIKIRFVPYKKIYLQTYKIKP